MSDRFVAEAANYATHNKYKRGTSMRSAGFEPTILASELSQTYVLNRAATGNDSYS